MACSVDGLFCGGWPDYLILLVTNRVVTQVNSKGLLVLPIAAHQNMELKSFINKML